MAAPDPGVDFFVSFPDLNPYAQKQCIYFVKKLRPDRRCMYDCSDNKRATELYRIITKREPEGDHVKDIQEYIRANCCAKAGHRDRILSSPLLVPLIKRWMGEIQEVHLRHSAYSSARTTSERTSRASSSVSSSCDTPASSATSRASTVETPLSTPSYSHPNRLKDCTVSPIPSQLDTSSTRPRYNLRSHAVDDSLIQLEKQVQHAISAEFTPHTSDPTTEDTVAFKFPKNLHERDVEKGSVYIYSRESSPGYVKIGWTAKSVGDRLAGWSECGYTPIELFRASGVPYAQRVETLTHYELIKEWRREETCKACLKRKGKDIRHQEWFEVSPDRAIQVLSTWVELFRKANLYDPNGSLTPGWREVVKKMKVKGETVTSTSLLRYYKADVAKRSPRVKKVVFVEAETIAKKETVVEEVLVVEETAIEKTAAKEEIVVKGEIVVKEEMVVKEEIVVTEETTEKEERVAELLT